MKINEFIRLLTRAVAQDLRGSQFTNNFYETRMSIIIMQRI
jgi:hypothetical protein